MSQRVSYFIIGLLAGLLLMEWVVRPADSQTITVRAQEFILVDANGNTTASLANGTAGPALSLGSIDGPHVYITAGPKTAGVSVTGQSGGPYAQMIGTADAAGTSVYGRSGGPYAQISGSGDAAIISVNGRVGEPYVMVGSSATTATMSVNGGGNNKTLIGADATSSSVTSGGVAVQSSLNGGHAVRLSATTQGGRVTTYRNYSATGRLPATARKLAAGPANTWGQVKAGELAEDESVYEPAVTGDVEFERLRREYEAQLEALDQQ